MLLNMLCQQENDKSHAYIGTGICYIGHQAILKGHTQCKIPQNKGLIAPAGLYLLDID